MNSQLYTTELEQANTAWQQAWGALLTLAKALLTPSHIPDALRKAEVELKEAQEVLKELEEAKKAVGGPAKARGTLGDENDEELRDNAEKVEEEAKELEEQKERAKRWQRWLQAGHVLVMGLVALCGIVLSFDAIRAGLGVAKDSQLLVALGGVALSCQVAAQALGTSWRHLGDTARQHRAVARRLRERAERVKIARDNAKATMATRGKITSALVPLREVRDWLRDLVTAVKEDMKTPGQEFTETDWALTVILTGLGTSGKHGDMARRLEEVQEELKRQREGTGR